MGLTIHDNLKNLPEESAAILNRELAARSAQPILLLFSGGSALSIVDFVDVSNVRANVTISVLDERYGEGNTNSNFARLVQKAFHKHAEANGAAFIDTRVQPGETLDSLATRFDQALKAWKSENPNGYILVTQGIGEDGHTAGVIGGSMKSGEFMSTFEDSDVWVVGYELLPTQSDHLKRVTATLAFLTHQVDFSLVYVSGQSKRPIVRTILAAQGYLSEYPALIVHSMRHVELCTDFPVK